MKIFTKRALLFLLLTFTTLAFSANDEYSTNDIQAIIPVLEKALNKHDIKALRAVYSAGATVIPKDTSVLKTNLDISSYWDRELENTRPRFMIDVVDSYVTEDLAYISALWTSTLFIRDAHINGGSEAIISDGYLYNVLYRLDDGSWKILLQQWD